MKIKSNAAINTAALAISSGLNFLGVFIWTRLLQPQEFGVYALVSATALFFNATVFEWLRLTGARTLYDAAEPTAINPRRADALFAIYAACAALFVCASALFWLLDLGVAGVAARWWPLMATFAITEMALAIVNTISRVRMNAWQFFRSLVLRAVGSIALGLWLVWGLDMGALGAILGIVVAQGAVVLGSIVLDPLWRTVRPWRAGRDQVRTILRLGAPLIFSCALTYAASVTDRFLIGGVLGANAVGLYAAPVDLLQKTLIFVMMAINLTAYPALVRAYEDHGAEAASAALDRNLKLQLGLGVPAAMGLAVLAPGITALLLGPEFRAAGARLLPLIALAALLRCLVTFHLMMVFQVTQRMRMMVIPPIVTLVVLVVAGVLGMRAAGLIGMALAAAAAQAASYAVCFALARRHLPLRIVSPDTIKIVLAGTGMGLLLFPFAKHVAPLETIALIALGGAAYGGLLIVLRVGFVTQSLRRVVARVRTRRT